MEKRPVGRPINPNSLNRVGQAHLFYLSKEDSNKLKKIAQLNQVSMSEVIRRLVREFNLEV